MASHSESPIPSFVNLDAPDSQAPEPERRFLEVNDIKKYVYFHSTRSDNQICVVVMELWWFGVQIDFDLKSELMIEQRQFSREHDPATT